MTRPASVLLWLFPNFCLFPLFPAASISGPSTKSPRSSKNYGSVNPALAAYVFLNRTDPQGQGTENAEAAALLGEIDGLTYLDAPLGSRKAFGHAATKGLAVTELAGHHNNPKATAEITALFKRCFNVTSILQSTG